MYFVLSIFLITSAFSFAEQQELLKAQDVNRIMQQIFAQHVDKKEMTAVILKNSFKVYIDQFDPDRIYLLEEEVLPYLQLNEERMEHLMEHYRKGEFVEYSNLHHLIQHAIFRSREIRAEIEKNKKQLFQLSKSYTSDEYEDWRDPDLKRLFPKNTAELKARIKHQLIAFLAAERKRYGDSQINRNENQTLALFEKRTKRLEDQYLFYNEKGHLMPVADQENLFYMHVLKALASSLDSHTTFLNPTEAYDMKVRLEKEIEGIGIIVKQAPEGGFMVGRLLEGSPASKSGLVKIYDRIIKIDGRTIAQESNEKVEEMLRGKSGTPVSLILKRINNEEEEEDKTIQVELKREPIVLENDRVEIAYEIFGNGIIGAITLHSFYQGNGVNSENDVREAIKTLDRKGNLRGLILDLRQNSGGFLSQAVKIAGLFITNGVIVVSKYFNGEEKVYRDMDGKVFFEGPLIVLTSKVTASAAEIVAQALQDYGVAVVVGDEHTYGKGTIQSQTVTENQGSSYFKVTVGKYYTVSGKTPQIQGVKADIVVPSQFTYENIGEEYLEFSVEQDTISPSYEDSLQDIDSNLKSWYMRYYTPTLQHQVRTWKKLIPVLKKNSEYRIAHNKDYQAFLSRVESKGRERSSEQQNYGEEDLQMAEAMNIMKDMIMLHARNREREGWGVPGVSAKTIGGSKTVSRH